MVSSKQLRWMTSMLKALRLLLILALPATLALFIATRPNPLGTSESQSPREHVTALTDAPRQHDLNWYAPLWQRNLKQSPIPVRPDEDQPPTAPQTPLPLLLATLVEPESRYAHFADKAGTPLLFAVDDRIESYRIAAIEPGRVQLQSGDRFVWLEVPKPAGER